MVLFTSNKPPSELYKNGLNRQYFLPFVDLVHKQLAVIEVRQSHCCTLHVFWRWEMSHSVLCHTCALRCYVLPSNAMPCCSLLCHAMLCEAMVHMSCHVMLWPAASTCNMASQHSNHQRAETNVQVSAAHDYRLQDQSLADALATPALRNAETQRMQMQQGVMLVGLGSHEALAVSWSTIVGSFQTEVPSLAAALIVISSQQSTTWFCQTTSCICLVLSGHMYICISVSPWHGHVAYHDMEVPSMFGFLRAHARVADMQSLAACTKYCLAKAVLPAGYLGCGIW